MVQIEKYIRQWGGNDEVVQAMLGEPEDAILLHISFDFLDWTRGDRSKELELEVLTEYYVTDMFSLVGNVGGQLGLFVSFSFIGCFGWLMNHSKMLSLISYFCSWFRTKDPAEPRWLLKLMQCWFLLIL